MAWGKSSSLRSCDALLKRVEDNDPTLTELVILPMKAFGPGDADRLSRAIANGTNDNLRLISASGHSIAPESLKRLGLALSMQAEREGSSSRRQSNNHVGEIMRGIESLAIGSKDMGDVGAIALCEGLEGSNGGLLRFVDLGWKNLGKEGPRAIGRTFGPSQLLKRLDLSRNANIGNEGIARLADAAEESAGDGALALPSLEGLALSECGVGPPGARSLAGMISGPKGARPKLIELDIGSNPLGREGCGALSALCAIPDVGSAFSRLGMPQCAVGDEGVGTLAAAAVACPCTGLRSLDLSGNSLTEDGARALAKSLAGSWPDLAELKLAKNNLGEQGAVSVMGALAARSDGANPGESAGKGNSTLRHLDLSCTGCGAEGARAALMSGALETLRLFGNRLGSEGLRAISPLLRGGHPSIVNLDLGGNNADEGAVVALLNSIADRTGSDSPSKLSVLEIGGNHFGKKAMDALAELHQAWPMLDVAHDKPVLQPDG